jgi:hypothetical protein
MNAEPLPRDEVAASVSALRALGSDYDDAVADALAERMEHIIDARVEERLNAHSQEQAASPLVTSAMVEDNLAAYRIGLAFGSLIFGIPLTAIAAGAAGGAAVAVVWIAIALINIAFNLGPRRRNG